MEKKKKIKIRLMRFFNIVKKELYNEKNIYYLPILKNEDISECTIKRLSKEINKILEKEESNTVALSDFLSENYILRNYLYSNNINILNGRFLFKCLTYNIIKYLFNIKKQEIELRRSFYTNK